MLLLYLILKGTVLLTCLLFLVAAGVVLLEEEEQEGRTQHQERRGEGDPWRPAARSTPGPGLLVKETHAMD